MFPKLDMFTIFFFSLLLYSTHNYVSADWLNDDIEEKVSQGYPLDSLLNFTEVTSEHGYSAEEHTVITEDGYILTIFRLPRGKNCQGPIRQPPVLLMHGVTMTSDLWLNAGTEAGLAYLISDQCYDLWVGNIRGNFYGRRHNELNPETDVEFWDFYVDEMGRFDLPAMIDYVLMYTSSKSINYIGYSQGGCIYLIMCSERQAYCKKVQVAILLGPGSRLTYTKSAAFRLITALYRVSWPFLKEISIGETLQRGGIVQQLVAYLCKNSFIADTFCKEVLAVIDSSHPKSIEIETIRVLVGHCPAGTSVKNMVWFNQACNVDVFQRFDYGVNINVERYNATTPPLYNLNATTTPTVVISGRNDYLGAPADIEWLTSHLPNVIDNFIVEDPLWNHFDIPWSKLTSKDILPRITQHLYKYSAVEWSLLY